MSNNSSKLLTEKEMKECLLLLEEWKNIIDSRKEDEKECCQIISREKNQFFMYE